MNAHGSAAIYTVILTPLLLLGLCVVTAACLLLLQWRRTHELCHVSLFDLQRQSGERFNSLFGLNPAAEELRAERTAAETDLKAAELLGPEAVIAAEIYFESVVVRQYALRARQELLKAQIYIEGNRSLVRTSNAIKKEKGVDGWPMFHPLQLAIRRAPESSLTPDYEPRPDFSQRQAVEESWHLNPSQIFPAWTSSFLPKLNVLNGTCSATLVNKGGLWKPQLGAGKFSWNY